MAFKRILLRRDTSSNWTSGNAVLASGEVGYETNTGKFKIGNGSTAWTSLGYSIASNISSAVLNDLGDVTITSAANGDFLRWNGSAWINDSVDLATDTIGSFVQSLVAGTGVTLSGNSGENATPTINVDTTVIQARVAEITDVEIGYLNGVTSAIQTQIDTKAPIASPTFTGTVVLPDNTVALGTKTTGDYVATITGGTGVTSTAATTGEGTTHSLSIGQAVATNSNVTFNDLTVAGNLTVSGTTTSINTETLTVNDNIVVLNNNVTDAPTENAGIEIERGSSANVVLRWNETDDKWQATNDGSVYGNIVTTAVGIAPSATVLATARNIAGQSFDGSASISIAPTDLTGVTSTAAELNILDGATLTVTELNYVDGVTSSVQTQLDLKAPLSSPTFTGTPTLPIGTIAVTQSAGNNTVAVATTAYADAAASAAASAATSSATLDTLSGVVIASPAVGQLLQFDGANFINATLSLTPDFSDANNILANAVFA